jgi:hypothetical protein
MTLILSAICAHQRGSLHPLDYAVQVSDRLLTHRIRDRQKVFDCRSNKTLIYRAKDAFVSIGYAGLAYIDKMPTDEWIAERLWGDSLPPRLPEEPGCLQLSGRAGGPCVRFGRPSLLDIGMTILRIKEDLECTLSLASNIEISIIGWQQSNKHCRPIAVQLIKQEDKEHVSLFHCIPRIWCGMVLLHNGISLSREYWKQKVREPAGKRWPVSSDEILGIFINTAREVSSLNSAVGKHLMCIKMYPELVAEVTFFEDEDHYESRGGKNIRVRYLPWLIGVRSLFSPRWIVSRQIYQFDGVKVVVHGAEPDEGGFRLISFAQRRRPWPPRIGG